MSQNRNRRESSRRQQTILDQAAAIVNGQNDKVYGTPMENFERTARMWSVLLSKEITPLDVAKCMIAVKLARLVNSPEHMDSYLDIAGYAACAERVIREN